MTPDTEACEALKKYTVRARADGQDCEEAIIKAVGRHDKYLRPGDVVWVAPKLMAELHAYEGNRRIRRLDATLRSILAVIAGKRFRILQEDTLSPEVIIVGEP